MKYKNFDESRMDFFGKDLEFEITLGMDSGNEDSGLEKVPETPDFTDTLKANDESAPT